MIAIYRSLYGEDFITESIESIRDHVDKVIVVLAPRPWGTSSGVDFQGKHYSWPEKFDNLREKAEAAGAIVIEDFFPSPFGQYQHILNNVVAKYLPSDVVWMEPDHVFHEVCAKEIFAQWQVARETCRSAMPHQVELWAPPSYKPNWRVPEREGRATVWFMKDCAPGQPVPDGWELLDGVVHNLGFCYSMRTMLWKHLTALAFAKEVGDCDPDPNWFEARWLGWHPAHNNKNLEISLKLAHKIPRIVKYDPGLLPTSIKRRYGYEPR